MSKMLEAHEKTIRKIFSGDYFFQIPVYQRPYSWGWSKLVNCLMIYSQPCKKMKVGSIFWVVWF